MGFFVLFLASIQVVLSELHSWFRTLTAQQQTVTGHKNLHYRESAL